MDKAPYVIGSHVFFFRDGDSYTSPTSGTASRTSKPGESDTGWVDLGVISASSDTRESEEIEIFAPTPGRKRLYDVVEIKDKLNIKFTTDELGPLGLEVLYKTLKLTSASTQFNPLEGATKKGWLKIQRYTQDDTQILVMDVFVHLKVASEVSYSGDGLAQVSFEAKVLHSTLNTATL